MALRRFFAYGWLIVFLVVVGACGSPARSVPVDAVVVIEPTEVALDQGASGSFTASVTGVQDASVAWTATGGTVDGSGSSVSYTAPAEAGTFVVTATSVADPSASASATVTVPNVAVTVEPASATVLVGDTLDLMATVSGTVDVRVTWSASCGLMVGAGATISYVAPALAGACTVTVASVADPSATATAAVLVAEVVVDVAPASVILFDGESATFSASVVGASDPSVTWSATGGTINGSGATVTYTAPGVAGSYVVTASSVEDPSASASATVLVDVVSVAIEPSSASVYAGETVEFTASVSGTSNEAVTWSATCGSLSGAGPTVTFEAPSFDGSCTVTATSVADPRRGASVVVEVLGVRPRVVSVSIVEGDQSLVVDGDPVQLTANVVVEGGASEAVTWSSSDEGVVTVSAGGEVEAVGEGVAMVTAASVADASVVDSIAVTARFGPFDDGALLWYAGSPDRITNREFVAVDGDLALVPFASGDSTGYVRVFRRLSGGGWIDSATLRPATDPERRYRRFGKAVELRGTTAVVLSEYFVTSDPYDTYESRVHIFERRGVGDWVERRLLLAGEGVGRWLSRPDGISYSLANGLLALGLPGAGATGLGVVRVYARDEGGAGAWGLVDDFESPAGRMEDGVWFGTDIDLSEDGTLMAVALSVQSNDSGAGTREAVYVLESVGGPDYWRVLDVIGYQELPGTYSNYVAIDGDILAVTELPVWFATSVEFRIFERASGGGDDWEATFNRTVAIQRADESLAMPSSTSSIRARGDTVVLGLAGIGCWDDAAPDDPARPCGPGEVHVFRRSAGTVGTWSRTQVLGPDPAYDHQVFGAAVDLSSDGRTLVVGTNPLSGFDGGSGGEVFVFER